jgi:hypothetical protein
MIEIINGLAAKSSEKRNDFAGKAQIAGSSACRSVNARKKLKIKRLSSYKKHNI